MMGLDYQGITNGIYSGEGTRNVHLLESYLKDLRNMLRILKSTLRSQVLYCPNSK